MEGTLSGCDAWFNNPDSEVSAQYGIGKDGTIHQYVKEDMAAWHAGTVNRPIWKGLRDNINPNLYTIGIEHEGKSGEPWTDEMIESSVWLQKEICEWWNIVPIMNLSIVRHSDINRLHAGCPGEGCPFEEIVRRLQ